MNTNEKVLDDVINQTFGNIEYDPAGIDFDMGFMLDDDDEFNAFEMENVEETGLNSTPIIKIEKGVKIPKATSRQNKKRKFNPDAAAIAQVTEETLKSLELDPNSKDGKKKKRQIRNRMSAQYHRDRKNAYIKNLEQIVNERTNEIHRLRDEVNALVVENNTLRASINGQTYASAPARYDSANYPTAIAVGGYTDNEDSDEYSVQSSGNSSSSAVPNYPQPSAAVTPSLDLTAVPVLPSIHTLPVFQRQQQFEVNFLPTSPYTSGTTTPLSSDAVQIRGGPAFASSPLSRSLTLISMVCVISIMFLGSGGRGGPLSSSSLSDSLVFPGGAYLDSNSAMASTSRRLLISTAPADTSSSSSSDASNSAMVVVKRQSEHTDGNAENDLSDLFMSFSLHVNNTSEASHHQAPQVLSSSNNGKDIKKTAAAAPKKRNLRHALEESESALNNSAAPLLSTSGVSPSIVRVKVDKGSADNAERSQQQDGGLSLVRIPLGQYKLAEDGASMFPNKGLYRLPDYGRSESVVFMSSGKALLDPAILRAPRRVPSATVVPQTVTRTVPSDTVHVVNAEEQGDKNSGALVPTAFQTRSSVADSDSASSVISYSASDKVVYDMPDLAQPHHDGLPSRQQVLTRLMSDSNMLTIQLPVSSIAMGKARHSSSDSSDTEDRSDEGDNESSDGLDAILRALNLQGMGSVPDGTSSDHMYGTYPQGAFEMGNNNTHGSTGKQQQLIPTVEFSCMIVNARLVMKNDS